MPAMLGPQPGWGAHVGRAAGEQCPFSHITDTLAASPAIMAGVQNGPGGVAPAGRR